eukprot:7389805-Prymnesium_polylepis.1
MGSIATNPNDRQTRPSDPPRIPPTSEPNKLIPTRLAASPYALTPSQPGSDGLLASGALSASTICRCRPQRPPPWTARTPSAAASPARPRAGSPSSQTRA